MHLWPRRGLSPVFPPEPPPGCSFISQPFENKRSVRSKIPRGSVLVPILLTATLTACRAYTPLLSIYSRTWSSSNECVSSSNIWHLQPPHFFFLTPKTCICILTYSQPRVMGLSFPGPIFVFRAVYSRREGAPILSDVPNQLTNPQPPTQNSCIAALARGGAYGLVPWAL